MTIDPTLRNRKDELLEYFRNRGAEALKELTTTYGEAHGDDIASAINQEVNEAKAALITVIRQTSEAEKWDKSVLLETILLATYASYVAMLEARNSVRRYEYMDFSRRIGELWEPFCRLCFDYPVNDVRAYAPPVFADVKKQLEEEVSAYIDLLKLTAEEKEQLKKYYEKVWALVDSGEIKLKLDLHFILKGNKYDVDFKSGFGSNEKGNTNRLLLVATIYKNLPERHECVLLVRSEEDTNNNYFQRLKKSGVWQAACGKEAYVKIGEYSGFDLLAWIKANIDWEKDLRPDTLKHFADNNLSDYLKW